MKKIFRFCIVAILLLGATIAVCEFFYLNRSVSAEEIEKAKVNIIHKTAFAIIADGKEVCYFSDYDTSDSSFVGVTQNLDSAFTTVALKGVWVNSSSFYPSANGMLLTLDETAVKDSIIDVISTDTRSFVEKNISRMQSKIEFNTSIKSELDYYLRCHSIYDNEYGAVANYSYSVKDDTEHLSSMVNLFESMLNNASSIKIEKVNLFYANINRNGNKESNTELYSFKKVSPSSSPFTDHILLGDVSATPVILECEELSSTPEGYSTLSTPVYKDNDFSFLAEVDYFILKRKMKQMLEENNIPLKHLVLKEFTDNDSLYYGTSTDLNGNIYVGKMTETGVPCGYGVMNYANGDRYEGEWSDSVRNGSGFLVSKGDIVKAGEWKADKYKGEKMTHDDKRVYGIDISRYQHEIGRKKYPINWRNLRITSLGNQHNSSVSGSVSFPVRFVYIKSTQSTSIKSAYYKQDAKDARKNGFLCGAYHFFSTKTSGKAQAEYFLSNTQILSGDMPPVLDVEPTDKEIVANGGEEAMFNKMREWLSIVEKRVGKRPILYVSQTFIKTYLVKAPDLCKNYQVWIARYNSYRPDVKLLFWQLTPYGRVEGIHGNVDINVFNGYDEQFDESVFGGGDI